MDVNDLRTLITVLAFLAFVGIVAWAWSGKRREHFEEAARVPLEDDGAAPCAGKRTMR